MVATRVAIAQRSLVQELSARQHGDGHWGDDDEAKPYTARGVVSVLTILHTLGVEPGEWTAAGRDLFLRFSQHKSGGFSMTKTLRSGIFPRTTGVHLPFLVYSGLGDAPRVRRAFAFLDTLTDAAWNVRDTEWIFSCSLFKCKRHASHAGFQPVTSC